MASRFVDAGSVDEFISEQENKRTAQKHCEMSSYYNWF